MERKTLKLVLMVGVVVMTLILSTIVSFAAALKPLTIGSHGPLFMWLLDYGPLPQAIAKLEAKGPLLVDYEQEAINRAKYLESEMNKIGYTVVSEDWGWAESLEQKELAALLAGKGLDIMYGEVQMPALARQGAFVDLSNEPWLKDLLPGTYVDMTFNGKVYGFAIWQNKNYLEFRKSLLKKAGLDPQIGPRTWSEWLDMSNKITAAGKGEFWGGGTFAGDNLGGPLRVIPLLRKLGSDVVDATGKPTINTPQMIQTLTFVKELNKNVPENAAAMAAEDPFFRLMGMEKMAFSVGCSFTNFHHPELDFTWGIVEIPLPDKGLADPLANVLISQTIYGIAKYSKNIEAAKKFLSIVASYYFDDSKTKPESGIWTYAYSPSNIKVYFDHLAKGEASWSQQAMYNALKSGSVRGLRIFPKENAKCYRLVQEAIVRAQVTDEPIETIVADVQAKIEDILK